MQPAIFLRTALILFSLTGVASAQTPAELAASRHSDPAPADLSPAISARIAPGGVRVTAGQTTLTFWWVRDLAVHAGSAAPSWSDVDEGTLVGIVRLDQDFRDIRGRVLKAGTYTLRYGIQPANGDHLGVSPFRDFLLLGPAAADTTADPLGHDGAIDLSKKSIGGSHPAVWSIDPPAATEAVLAVHTTDLGHKAIVMDVPASRDGKPAGSITFGIVLIGKIEA